MIAIVAAFTMKKHKNEISVPEKQPDWNQWSEKEEVKPDVPPVVEEPELKLEEPTSFKHAVELAKKRNVNIFVFFESDNCGYCTKMKEQLSKPEAMKKLSNYVVYFCNAKEERKLAHKNKVYGVPAYFVFDKNEEKLKSGFGYKDESQFIQWLGEDSRD